MTAELHTDGLTDWLRAVLAEDLGRVCRSPAGSHASASPLGALRSLEGKSHSAFTPAPSRTGRGDPLPDRRGSDRHDLGAAAGVDVTSAATVPADSIATGEFVARRGGVVAGLALIDAVLRVAGGHEHRTSLERSDGDAVRPGDLLATVHGPTRLLLTVERTVLNLLGHLGGVATETRRWVEAVAGTSCAVRDTRKTTPLMRGLEKYAVRCGGGVNHRMSLSDEALVKDNHVLAAGGVAPAYRAVRAAYPELPVQVEVDTYEQAIEAVDAGADLLLLDNMGTAELRRTVERVGGRATLEASGGLTLERAADVAATGVDYIAVGALTHSAPVLDIGLDLMTPGD